MGTNKGLSYLKTILIASQLIHLQYRLRHDCTPHRMKHIRFGGLKEVGVMSASDADLWGEDIVEGCKAGSLIVVAAEQMYVFLDFKIKI